MSENLRFLQPSIEKTRWNQPCGEAAYNPHTKLYQNTCLHGPIRIGRGVFKLLSNSRSDFSSLCEVVSSVCAKHIPEEKNGKSINSKFLWCMNKFVMN